MKKILRRNVRSMSEAVEQPAITPELIAAYQRQQAARHEQERRQLIEDLRALAAERGFAIVAGPLILEDGRLAADWGVMAAR